MQTLGQLWRVVVVNSISAGVDYGLLFLLSWATGITRGDPIILLNAVSFTAGTTVSYIFNKNWSFGDHSQFDHHKKFTLFLLVAITAVTVNTLVVRIISTDIQPIAGLSAVAWLLVSKLIASAFSFTVNFSGYKFVVFKK